ncbi:MAG: hypothetical protein IKI09_09410 [Bacteroidales bacterium]|nr:hypothetical protein [Bacteroidales bacterium]
MAFQWSLKASKQHQAQEKGESYEQISFHSDKNSEFAAITTFFPTFAARNTLFNMITQDQLKDLCKRIDALRRYL